MNTEDRVMSVLARANPMPDSQPVDMASEANAYLATLDQRSSEVTQLDTRDETKHKRGRGNWLLAAAVVAIILGLAIFLLTSGEDEAPVATDPTVETTVPTETTMPESSQELSPELEDALAVATAFTQARVDHDTEVLNASAVEGHIIGFVVGNLERMPEEFAWLEAVGWVSEVTGCEVTNADIANTQVECQVSHQNSLSEALGEGPFEGTYVMKVMFAGDQKLGVPITETTVAESLFIEFPVSDFVNGTWSPFIDWLQQNHSADASVMLGAEIGENEIFRMLSAGWQIPTTTPESIELWRQHVTEFVAEQSG